MPNPIYKAYGIRDPTPACEPRERQAALIPPEHPCYGCIILNTQNGVPYCFLPRCHRDIFETKENAHA